MEMILRYHVFIHGFGNVLSRIVLWAHKNLSCAMPNRKFLFENRLLDQNDAYSLASDVTCTNNRFRTYDGSCNAIGVSAGTFKFDVTKMGAADTRFMYNTKTVSALDSLQSHNRL